MSLLRDMVVTLGDALRLSGDLMRRNLENRGKTLKRTIGRIIAAAILMIGAALFGAAGAGFIIYGIFAYIAGAVGWPASGLIIGGGLLVLSIIVFLVGRSAASG